MATPKKNEDYLEKIEQKNLNKFVENYLKMDLDPLEAYKKSFDKQLWKTDGNAKKRAQALMSDMKFIEVKNEKIYVELYIYIAFNNYFF